MNIANFLTTIYKKDLAFYPNSWYNGYNKYFDTDEKRDMSLKIAVNLLERMGNKDGFVLDADYKDEVTAQIAPEWWKVKDPAIKTALNKELKNIGGYDALKQEYNRLMNQEQPLASAK